MTRRIAATLLLLTITTPAWAENNNSTNSPNSAVQAELLQSALKADRKAIIADNIALTAEEADRFWPVYHAYRIETNRLNATYRQLIDDYLRQYQAHALSDKQALKLLNRQLANQQARIQLKQRYVKKFKRVIAAKQVARFFQIDQRLDTIDMLKIAQHMPLMP